MEYMNTTRAPDTRVAELVDILTAISVVSKRLAGKIADLNVHNAKGMEETNEQNE